MARCVMNLLGLALIAAVLLPAQTADALAAPPTQPESGPGGQDYTYGCRTHQYGEGADGYWLFEPVPGEKTPADAGPRPVILYAHGLNATHYGTTWLWIQHMVRKGNFVVYPRYQQGAFLDHTAFTQTTAQACADAIKRMDGVDHPKADLERFAMAGHSLGGTIIVNLAARYEHYGLPRPKALMSVLPGDVRTHKGLAAFLPGLTEDHTTVPAGTLMLVVASENDSIVGRRFAERIYKNTRLVDSADKDLILLGGDDHGRPRLIADHFVPNAYTDSRGRDRADAFDFALWRWFDALTDAAFYDGKHRKFALGNTPEQRDLGRWSDGRPVREPQVLDPVVEQ